MSVEIRRGVTEVVITFTEEQATVFRKLIGKSSADRLSKATCGEVSISEVKKLHGIWDELDDKLRRGL